MVCTLAMLAGALTVVRPAQAAQDGNLRIEIDNPAVGNWNVSQEGQSVGIAVGQKVSFSLWNFNGSGVQVAANTAHWYVDGNPIALCKSAGDSGSCQQNNSIRFLEQNLGIRNHMNGRAVKNNIIILLFGTCNQLFHILRTQ